MMLDDGLDHLLVPGWQDQIVPASFEGNVLYQIDVKQYCQVSVEMTPADEPT